MTKIAVGIPMYNISGYIEKCLESLSVQTHEDFVVFCINDGSTDSTRHIAQSYAEKDGRFRVLDQENKGTAAARNRVLECIFENDDFDYLYFIDADDFLDPEALEHLVDCACKRNTDVLFFGGRIIVKEDASHAAAKYEDDYYTWSLDYADVSTGVEFLAQAIDKGEFKSSVAIQFYRTSFLKKTGLRFYEGILHEDELFTTQILLLAERVSCITEVFYNRTLRANSIMTNPTDGENVLGYFTGAVALLEFCRQRNLKLEGKLFDVVQARLDFLWNGSLFTTKDIGADKVTPSFDDSDDITKLLYKSCIAPTSLYMANLERQADESRAWARELDERLNAMQEENNRFQKSTSYRIGRAITALPRAVKRLVSP